MNKIFNIIYNTNAQKILDFLLSHPDEEFYDRQISKLTGISKSGTNSSLRDLAGANLIRKEKRGRMCFYSIDNQDFLIKQMKILQNLIIIYSLVEKLKPHSIKILLYGSSASGENSEISDIDIFIQTRNTQKVKRIIYNDPLREKIQYVINTPNEFAKLKKENPVFYEEISKGITLWEKK